MVIFTFVFQTLKSDEKQIQEENVINYLYIINFFKTIYI